MTSTLPRNIPALQAYLPKDAIIAAARTAAVHIAAVHPAEARTAVHPAAARIAAVVEALAAAELQAAGSLRM